MTPLEQLKEEIQIIVKNSINGTISNRELNKFISKAISRYIAKHHIPDIGKMVDLCPLTNSSHEKALVRVVEKRMQQLNEEGLYMGSTDIEYIQVLCACGHILSECEVKNK